MEQSMKKLKKIFFDVRLRTQCVPVVGKMFENVLGR